MILKSLASQVFYRMNSPRWAFTPTSGAGAARQGGRLNRKGVEALYLSADTTTAIAEYMQTSAVLAPGTLVSYTVSASSIVDFSAGFDARWDPLRQDFYCDWRNLVFDLGIEPPTWVLSDMVMAAGCQGILFPSIANPGGVNMVVYHGMLGTGDRLEAVDPHRDLPRDQSSWS